MGISPEHERLVREIGSDIEMGLKKYDRFWYTESTPSKGYIEIIHTKKKTKYKILLSGNKFLVAMQSPEKDVIGTVPLSDSKLLKKLISFVVNQQNKHDRWQLFKEMKKNPNKQFDPLLDVRQKDKDPYPWHHRPKGCYTMEKTIAALLKKKQYGLLKKIVKSWHLRDYAESVGNVWYLLADQLDKLLNTGDKYGLLVDESKISNDAGYIIIMDENGDEFGTLKVDLVLGGPKGYPIYKFENIKVVEKFDNPKLEKALIQYFRKRDEEFDPDGDLDGEVEETTKQVAKELAKLMHKYN